MGAGVAIVTVVVAIEVATPFGGALPGSAGALMAASGAPWGGARDWWYGSIAVVWWGGGGVNRWNEWMNESERNGSFTRSSIPRSAVRSVARKENPNNPLNAGFLQAILRQMLSAARLRIGSYNVRVDHDQDYGTIHDWPLRRPLVADSIRACRCDVLALQEPSPAQAHDLTADLGPEWCVAVSACDPAAWEAAGASGPADGQARDGNGFVWNASRMELLEGGVRTVWLNDQPQSRPWSGPDGAWGGSTYQRTAVLGRFRDRQSGAVLAVISAHLDHAGDDLRIPRGAHYAPPPPGAKVEGSEARVRSVELIMRMAKEEEVEADAVVVCGDMNTFRDRDGQCYRALLHGAGTTLVDVRDAPGVLEVDSGRGAASWEGWSTNAWCRELKPESEGYPNRYDQVRFLQQFHEIQDPFLMDVFLHDATTTTPHPRHTPRPVLREQKRERKGTAHHSRPGALPRHSPRP